jgi:hypothetical protein
MHGSHECMYMHDQDIEIKFIGLFKEGFVLQNACALVINYLIMVY